MSIDAGGRWSVVRAGESEYDMTGRQWLLGSVVVLSAWYKRGIRTQGLGLGGSGATSWRASCELIRLLTDAAAPDIYTPPNRLSRASRSTIYPNSFYIICFSIFYSHILENRGSGTRVTDTAISVYSISNPKTITVQQATCKQVNRMHSPSPQHPTCRHCLQIHLAQVHKKQAGYTFK